MLKKIKQNIKKILVISTLTMVVTVFVPINIVKLSYRKNIYTDISKIPEKPVALVLGAAVWQGEYPSHALEDRLISAIELYKNNKVQKLVMSGDNSKDYYNEPIVMKEYAMDNGVAEEDIVLDYAGFRTYDSCYRMRDIFEVEDLIIVTQAFHLPRSIYICNELGVTAVGYKADKRILRDAVNNSIREFLATWLAWWQVNISKPNPKFLGDVEEVF